MTNVFVKGNNLYNHAKMNGLNMNPGWKPTTSYNNSVFCNYQDTTTSSCSGSDSNSGFTNFLNILTMGLSIFGMVSAFKSLNAATKGSDNTSNGKGDNNKTTEAIDQSVSTLQSAMDKADKTYDYDALQTAVKNAWEEYNANLKAIDTAESELKTANDDVDAANKKIGDEENDIKTNLEPAVSGAEKDLKTAGDELSAANAMDSKDPNKSQAVNDATAKKQKAQDALDKAKEALKKAQDQLKTDKDGLPKLKKNVEDKTRAKAELVKKNNTLKDKIDEANKTLDKRGKKVENTGSQTGNGAPVGSTGTETTSTGNYPFTTQEDGMRLSKENTTAQTGTPEAGNSATQPVDGSNQTDNKNNGTTQEDGMRKSLISEAQALGIYNKDDETKSMESLQLEITNAKNKVIDQIHEINKDAKTDNLSASELVSMLNTLKGAQKSNISFGMVKSNTENQPAGNDNQQPDAKTAKTEVKIGDKGCQTLADVAYTYKVNLFKLAEFNGLKVTKKANGELYCLVYPQQVIKIPN